MRYTTSGALLYLTYACFAVYQKALLTPELDEVFKNAPTAPANNVHNHRITKAWQDATGTSSKATSTVDDPEVPTGKRKVIEPDDTCPVCYEDIHGESTDNFVYCEESCRGPIHRDCFNTWVGNCRGSGKKVTCVYCRATWPGIAGAAAGRGVQVGGQPSCDGQYLNLADVIGIDRERDRSTYYYGPRTG